MAEKIGHDTIRTLIEHGVIAPKQPSEPKPTLAALFAAAVERGWKVLVRPMAEDSDETRPESVSLVLDTGVRTIHGEGPLLTTLAEATAEALED